MSYTPTTEDVRDGYSYAGTRQEFDRWLAEHDREVKAQAWEHGAFDAALSLGHGGHNATNPYKEEA